MKSDHVILMVGINCPPKNDQRFNEWYEDEHIPSLFKYKGIKKLTRFSILEGANQNYKNTEYPRYLAIYSFENEKTLRNFIESPEFIAARKEAVKEWGEEGLERYWWTYYKELRTWQ
ncbi:DUF4286 family protein [Chloroflexota bacterium]